MHTKHKGILLISIPKSGTMFVSRYLEKLTASPVVFGLAVRSEMQLLSELACGWHPQIQDALRKDSPTLESMSRRFALMLARNRNRTRTFHSAGSETAVRIVSDHGLDNFLRFLVRPADTEIQSPQQLLNWAEQRGLACVYLYRDIRAIANSLTHFLADGKSFLLDIDSVRQAAELVSNLYAPVLAEQMRQWEALKNDADILSVSYEALMQNPAKWMGKIAARGNLQFEQAALLNTADTYPSWTFRKNKTAWHETFTRQQQERIASLCAGQSC